MTEILAAKEMLLISQVIVVVRLTEAVAFSPSCPTIAISTYCVRVISSCSITTGMESNIKFLVVDPFLKSIFIKISFPMFYQQILPHLYHKYDSFFIAFTISTMYNVPLEKKG
jgi:hypothetical protein